MRSDDYVEMSATCFIEAIENLMEVVKKTHPRGGSVLNNDYWRLQDIKSVAYRGHKFVFGDVAHFDDEANRNNTMSLAQTARSFYANGLTIAPFPELWFEWDTPMTYLGGVSYRGIYRKQVCLIRASDKCITFQTFSGGRKSCSRDELTNDGWNFTGWEMVLDRSGLEDATEDGVRRIDGLMYDKCHSAFGHFDNQDDRDAGGPDLADHVAAQRSLACMAMLMARETKVAEKHPPSGLVAHRLKKGKVPLFSHKVVTIDPQRIVYEGGGQSSGIKRASPRLHWRRGHVRTLGSGKKIGIPPCIIGAAENGILDKTYRVRPKPEDMHDPC